MSHHILLVLALLLSAIPVHAGCPESGSVDRDRWHVEWTDTTSDGFEIHSVTWNDDDVLTRAKIVEWHADQGGVGFVVSTGCGGAGGAFPVAPFGSVVVEDLVDPRDGMTVIGFQIIRDYRMVNWGANCNWRFDQRYWFYTDGSFRIVAGAYGRGCAAMTTYRPVMRIDLAIDGDADDAVDVWSGSWDPVTTETTWSSAPANVYGWRIQDISGTTYYVEPATGQFDDDARGDDPFAYVTLHHASEGDADMTVIGPCCEDDATQGPDTFVNGENVDGANVVFWYVPQAFDDQDDLDGDGFYAWTVTGEPMPETYPAFLGPRFVRGTVVAVPGSTAESTGPRLLGIAPNPAFGSTSIRIQPASTGNLDVQIYDAAGRRVRTFRRSAATPIVEIAWDGKDQLGRDVSAGTYFVSARTAEGVTRGRIALVR